MMIEKQHEFALTTSREYMKIQEIEPPWSSFFQKQLQNSIYQLFNHLHHNHSFLRKNFGNFFVYLVFILPLHPKKWRMKSVAKRMSLDMWWRMKS